MRAKTEVVPMFDKETQLRLKEGQTQLQNASQLQYRNSLPLWQHYSGQGSTAAQANHFRPTVAKSEHYQLRLTVSESVAEHGQRREQPKKGEHQRHEEQAWPVRRPEMGGHLRHQQKYSESKEGTRNGIGMQKLHKSGAVDENRARLATLRSTFAPVRPKHYFTRHNSEQYGSHARYGSKVNRVEIFQSEVNFTSVDAPKS